MQRFLTAFSFCFLLIIGLSAQEPDVAAAPPPISLNGEIQDDAISERIRSIFGAIEAFKSIEVDVSAGVVTLSGTVRDGDTEKQAIELANRIEGVVTVLDKLEGSAEVSSQLSPVADKIAGLFTSFLKRLPLIGLALLTIFFFWWLSSLVFSREEWFARLRLSSLARDLARRIARLVILAVGLVIALEILDATAVVGAVLGAAGLAGLAIGFAFKSIIENYLAGVLLSTRNPFEIGDEIEINGNRGKVARLTARDTVLVTLDGNHLRIPNGIVINSELLNFTRNPKRRFEFEVGVSVELDLNEARRVGLAAMRENPAVLDDPKPVVLVDTLGDSAVVLLFKAWLNQSHHDFWKTRSETIRLVKTAYDDAGIEMPEPIYRVHMREAGSPSPAQKRDDKIEIPVPGQAMIEEDLSADRTINEQIEEDAARSGEENLLTSEAGREETEASPASNP